MTTMPFPTTTGISAAYDQGSAQVHQHLTAALGALGQMDANVHGAIDMLNSEIDALRAFLQRAANTPDVTAQQALQLLQLEDAVNQAQTQTTTPAQAATASTGLRSLFNSMFGRPANTPIVPAAPIPAAPVASQPAQTAPAATTPGQPAQAQPPAPAAPVATTPAAGSNTPANPWFVGDHPNSQPISPVGTDAWGRQVGDALDNHRDGINDLHNRVSRVEQMLTGITGGRTPNWNLGGIIGAIVGLLVGLWSFSQNEQTLVFAIITGAIAALVVAIITALVFATTATTRGGATNPNS